MSKNNKFKVTEVTTGKLTSTTDMKLAKLLNTKVSIKKVVGKNIQQIKRIDRQTVEVVAKNELYYFSIA